MRMTSFAVGVAVAMAAAGCTTTGPMPFASGKDCFYPSCTLSVEVVDDGKGGKRLKVEGDGNVRMGTRHRVVAIIWNLKTPGYTFGSNSVLPHTSRATPGKPWTSHGTWSSQIVRHGYWDDNSISVTNLNNERGMLYYDLVVFPDRFTPGEPITFEAAIANDAWQGRESGWVSMN